MTHFDDGIENRNAITTSSLVSLTQVECSLLVLEVDHVQHIALVSFPVNQRLREALFVKLNQSIA